MFFTLDYELIFDKNGFVEVEFIGKYLWEEYFRFQPEQSFNKYNNPFKNLLSTAKEDDLGNKLVVFTEINGGECSILMKKSRTVFSIEKFDSGCCGSMFVTLPTSICEDIFQEIHDEIDAVI